MRTHHHNFKTAAVQVPLMLGLASLSALFLMVGRSLVQNIVPESNPEQTQTIVIPTNENAIPAPPAENTTQIPQPLSPAPSTESGGQQVMPAQTAQPIQGEKNLAPQPLRAGQDKMPIIAQPGNENQNEDADSREEFVDPREIKGATNQIKDMKKEIKRLNAQLKKLINLNDEKSKLDEVSAQLEKFLQDLKTPPEDSSLRDVLQEFYDAQLWDTVNEVRTKVEFPKQVKQIEKELTRVAKLLKQKSYQKLGLDLESIKASLNTARTSLEEAKNQYQAGEAEEAMEALRSIFEDTNPGDVSCVLNSFRDVNRDLPRIKNAEVKSAIQDILDPIKEAVKNGDYREACRSFDEIRDDMFKVMRSASKTNKVSDPKMIEKLDKFKQLIEDKFGKETQQETGPSEESNNAIQ
jgi:cytochrome c556